MDNGGVHWGLSRNLLGHMSYSLNSLMVVIWGKI